MDTYNVLHTMVIGKNTAVVVDRAGEEFRNGIEIKVSDGRLLAA